MNQRTKDHRRWHKELVTWWAENDMPYHCERCGGTFGLAFAHSRKRRFIDTRELYFEVAALCQKCHQWTEYGDKDNPGTHERMERLIKEIIAKR